MAKISVNMHFTIRLAPIASNQFIKVGCEIDDIDTELPLDNQLQKLRQVLPASFDALIEEMERQVNAATGYKIVKDQSSQT